MVSLSWLSVVAVSLLATYGSIRSTQAATADTRNTGRITPITNPAPKSRPGHLVMEPAFAQAGRSAGTEIWRIENFKPVPYPKNDYGKFFTGDSYIILVTKEKSSSKSWDIYFWLGLETTQDEAGTAAIMAVHLDDQLGGAPIQHREVQDHESQQFLSVFKNGIRYTPGGIQSGFKHVDRTSFEKVFYHVKGKRNIRVKQVDVTVASMNKGDCFILDIGTDIYVYQGEQSKRLERLKSISAANQIRDQDHGGRSKVHIIEPASSQSDVDEFFTALGGGSLNEVPEESAGGDDEQFEKGAEKTATLHKVSDASGRVQIQQISQKPFEQSALDTNDAFILDTGDSNIFVWVGKKCTNQEKNESMKKAEEFLKANNYPKWTHVTRVVDGGEPAIFKQYFKSWKNADEKHTRLIRSTDKKPAPPKLEQKSAGTVPDFMPDNGGGKVEIFRVENMELKPIDPKTHGIFFGGDSYVVQYEYNNNFILYIWQGKTSTQDEKSASAVQAIGLDDKLGGKAIQIRVTQDHEPKHFMHIFQGKMIVFLGGKASGFKNMNDHDTYVKQKVSMFRIRGTTATNVKASQQFAEADSLQSDDVFIVTSAAITWIWQGKDSDEVERKLATSFLSLIAPAAIGNAVIVTEGKEPFDFWVALGGKERNYKENFLQEVPIDSDEPKLTHCYMTSKGDIKFETMTDFERDDLSSDDVMILDAFDKIFVWIGKGADDVEKASGVEIAHKFVMKNNRENTVIFVIKEGEEPQSFKTHFPKW